MNRTDIFAQLFSTAGEQLRIFCETDSAPESVPLSYETKRDNRTGTFFLDFYLDKKLLCQFTFADMGHEGIYVTFMYSQKYMPYAKEKELIVDPFDYDIDSFIVGLASSVNIQIFDPASDGNSSFMDDINSSYMANIRQVALDNAAEITLAWHEDGKVYEIMDNMPPDQIWTQSSRGFRPIGDYRQNLAEIAAGIWNRYESRTSATNSIVDVFNAETPKFSLLLHSDTPESVLPGFILLATPISFHISAEAMGQNYVLTITAREETYSPHREELISAEEIWDILTERGYKEI